MPKAGLDALLRPQDSVVVLIDHQPFQFASLNSHEPTMIVNNVVGLAAMSDSQRTRRPCNGRDRHRAQISLAQQPERLT